VGQKTLGDILALIRGTFVKVRTDEIGRIIEEQTRKKAINFTIATSTKRCN